MRNATLRELPSSTLYEIARLYLEEGLNGSEIGRRFKEENRTIILKDEELRLDLSPLTVSRALTKARRLKIIRETISPPSAAYYESRLEAKPAFENKRAWVVDVPDDDDRVLKSALGDRAAQFCLSQWGSGTRVAVSSGSTLWSWVERMAAHIGPELAHPTIRNLELHSALILVHDETVQVSVPSVLGRLLQLFHGSTAVALQLPELRPNGMSEERLSEIYAAQCQPLIDQAAKAEFVLTSVGAIDLVGMTSDEPGPPEPTEFRNLLRWLIENERVRIEDESLKRRVVAEVAYQPLDEEGVVVDHPDFAALRSRNFAVPLGTLRDRVQNGEAKVILVGGGRRKHTAMLAAVRHGFASHVITDSQTAHFLLDRL